VSDGKERGKRWHARKNVVDGYARRLALADTNHQRSQLVRSMMDDLRDLDRTFAESAPESTGAEFTPSAE
jgi:hypothetical protein